MKRMIVSVLLICTLAFTACNDSASSDTDTSANADEITVTGTDTVTEDTEEIEKTMYYLRTPEQPPKKTEITYPVYEFESYEEACKKASDEYIAATGYAVYSENGEFLFGLNNEYITNMMYRAKYVADFAKANGYVYGSAAINPAFTYHKYLDGGRRLTEKVVSCDRYVGWVLYEMGYTDQPEDGGMYVYGGLNDRDHNLMLYLDRYDYERIDSTTDFKAGDIVFVRPAMSSIGEPYGAHVFICAGSAGRGGMFYRYDHGNVRRIQCIEDFASYAEKGQPTKEMIGGLFCVYRPTQTTKTEMPNLTPAE